MGWMRCEARGPLRFVSFRCVCVSRCCAMNGFVFGVTGMGVWLACLHAGMRACGWEGFVDFGGWLWLVVRWEWMHAFMYVDERLYCAGVRGMFIDACVHYM